MAKTEIKLPAMGEGIIEATITKWLKSVGEPIEEDESIVEIATDKVDSEIPSPTDGIIDEILFQEGDIPKVGDIIAILKTEGAEGAEGAEDEAVDDIKTIETKDVDINPAEELKIENIPGIEKTVENQLEDGFSTAKENSRERFLSPLVKSIVLKEGIASEELDKLKGSGQDGRITKNDILRFLGNKKKPSSTQASYNKIIKESSTQISAKQNPVPIREGDEIIEMDRMRRLIADYMVKSKQISPHVTSFHEVDVSNIVNWRNKIKNDFLNREHEKLTFTPIFFEAAAKAIKELPMINVSVDGYNIIKRNNINIGMATALPNGNLIVPVIKNVDQKNLLGITKAVNDLANRARNNKLMPDEIQGGTFTITNFGSFGNLTGSPIINQPEVAILGLGAILKKPAVIETPEGDAIAIRHKIILSLAYDHRVVDGALGGMFLKKLAHILENFDTNRVS